MSLIKNKKENILEWMIFKKFIKITKRDILHSIAQENIEYLNILKKYSEIIIDDEIEPCIFVTKNKNVIRWFIDNYNFLS